jgi:hypothetical protein
VLDRDCDPTPDSRASVIAFRCSLLGTPEAIRLGLVGVAIDHTATRQISISRITLGR